MKKKKGKQLFSNTTITHKNLLRINRVLLLIFSGEQIDKGTTEALVCSIEGKRKKNSNKSIMELQLIELMKLVNLNSILLVKKT